MIAVSVWRFGFVGLLLGLTACGKPGRKVNPGHPLPAAALVAKCAPGQPGGRLVLALEAGPPTFNPLFTFDGVTRLLYGSLVNGGPAMLEPGPGLAESWSVAEDQKTWTFKLRPGVRWSDGVPLTADDVVFTWNQIMYNPECNRATFDLFRIGGKPFEVTNVDDFTVRVVTPEVFAPFVEFFGSVAILPKHALENAVRQRRFPFAYSTSTPPERIIGCGPYRVKEVRPGRSVLLERNPEYWVADSQGRRLPYFDEVQFTFGGPGTEGSLFLAGKSDACETVRQDNYESFKQAAAQGRCQLAELGIGAERDFLWFNQNTGTDAAGKPLVNPAKLKWFRNKKFRQAISCAIDRERLVRQAYGGRAQPIHSFISTENPKWNNPNVARYGYDLARARALLGEAGLSDPKGEGVLKDAEGNPVEIQLYSNGENVLRQKAAALIQEDLKQVGIKLVCTPLDFRALVEKINGTFDYECALMGLGGGGADPASQINVLRSSEDLHQWFPRQKSPATDWEARIDTLMDAQMRTLDLAERKKSFDEVQAILAEELPMIYTVAPFASAAIRPDIGNVRPSVLTPFRVTWNLEELYFKKPGAGLIVGMELNYPPFETVAPQGKPTGISVELAEALGKSLGREVQIQNLPFDGLIPALKTGKIDLIISSMTETPQRAQSIDFSEPYLRTGLCLLVNRKAAIHSVGDADLDGYSIAVKQGTTGQAYAQTHLKHARLLVLDKEDACVLEVVQGKAQAFIYDQMSVFKHWQQHQDATLAVLEPFQNETWAIGVRKGNDPLRAQVNAFLKAFRADGGFERLGDKYLREQKQAFEKTGIPFYF